MLYTIPRAKLHGPTPLTPLANSLPMFAAKLALLCALAIPTIGLGQGHHHYKLIDIGTFGGPQSFVNPGSGNDTGNYAMVLNSGGSVTGSADTSTPDPFPAFCFADCFIGHTFVWKNGVKRDMGALPGGASSAGNWISTNGLIAGLSQNGETDPLISGLPELRATLWAHGRIIDLGVLPEGGFESVANSVNSKGQVVGSATNAIPDPDSMVGAGFQTRAFIWQNGAMEDLGTLGTGTDAQAILINEPGQVVGWSYTGTAPSALLCPFPLTTGSFVWERGKGMQDLGSFGGTCTVAFDQNDRGQIVGESTLSGDQAAHAFLWDNGVVHDLGGSLGGSFTGAFAINQSGRAVGFALLPGDTLFHAALWTRIGQLTDLGVIGADQCSMADSINAQMQVVGSSSPDCFAMNVRAFLWEDGTMFDLNALIPPDSGLYLQLTETINSRGEIAGTGSDVHGNTHAFLLIPCDEGHPDIEGCDYRPVEVSTVAASHATETQKQLTPQEISRIRDVLMKRHRGFMPRTMH